jgi:uncharacterized protein (TIGR02594 family)
LKRREFLTAGALGAAATLAGSPQAEGQAAMDDADTLGLLGPDAFLPQTVDSKGSRPSRNLEVATAFRLLFNAPRTNDARTVAQYFADLKETNQEGEPYNRQWEPRINPLIVGFFGMTGTKPGGHDKDGLPNGDMTDWCAAFVSFCLCAAGRKSLFSPASASYRDYGHRIDENVEPPRIGDLAVFKETKVAWKGHVGFFEGFDADGRIKVLGGNQRVSQSKMLHEVSTKSFPRTSGSLDFYCFQRVVPASNA